MTRRPRRRGRARVDRQVMLAVAAGVLATAAFAGCNSRSSARAPDCAPGSSRPGSASWDDADGCWERRPDGNRAFRTSFGGNQYYYSQPPGYSRYADTGGRWSSGSKAGSGYRGAPSASA